MAYEYGQDNSILVDMCCPNWVDAEIHIPWTFESDGRQRIALDQFHWASNPPLWHLRRSFCRPCPLCVMYSFLI